MEAELMREPWNFSRDPASCAVTQRVTDDNANAQRAEEDPANVPFSSWEENFQDLSGWCIANIQTRCDFPTGESAMAFKLTGTRNEGSDVLTAAEETTRSLLQAIEKKISNGGDASVCVHRPEPVTCVVPPQLDHAYPLAGQQQQQQQQIYFNNNNNNNNNNNINGINNINAKNIVSHHNNLKSSGNTWMGLPEKIKTTLTVNNNSVAWQELNELGVTAAATNLPLHQNQQQQLQQQLQHQQQQKQQQQQHNGVTELEAKQYEQQRDNQDVFQILENDASNSFDLLSYLYEDNIPSPGDSVSTDSSRLIEVNSLPRLSSNSSAHIVVSPRTYEPITLSTSTATDALKSRLQEAIDSPNPQESPKLSPASSTSSKTTTVTHRSSYQLRTGIVKIEKPESPPPMERRSTRPRRTRANSNASRSSSSRGSGNGSRGKKRILDEVSDSDDENYRETREKNNEASRKSRMNKKAKEMEMAKRAVELEKDNRILKMKVEELEKLVTSMRNTLLRSALKRKVKTNMF